MKCLAVLIGGAILGLVAACPAYAAFTVSGDMEAVSLPPATPTSFGLPDARIGAYESNEYVRIWHEGTVDVDAIAVDHDGTPGLRNSTNIASATGLKPDTLGPGTYQSYMLHFDRVGVTPGLTLEGAVEFSPWLRIVGVVLSTANLAASDDDFNTAGTLYSSGSTVRGLEMGTNSTSDRFTISADGRTFSFNGNEQFHTIEGIDQVRLIVQAVPEFTTILSWGLLAGIGCVAYRRCRK